LVSITVATPSVGATNSALFIAFHGAAHDRAFWTAHAIIGIAFIAWWTAECGVIRARDYVAVQPEKCGYIGNYYRPSSAGMHSSSWREKSRKVDSTPRFERLLEMLDWFWPRRGRTGLLSRTPKSWFALVGPVKETKKYRKMRHCALVFVKKDSIVREFIAPGLLSLQRYHMLRLLLGPCNENLVST
jgi:hypothetical protein